MRFLTSGFFHESIVPGPWIHMLKYFQKYFRFRWDIHKIRFFRSDFRGTIPGNLLISGYFRFTKIVFLENVRVWFPGNHLISGYCYPEINWFPSNNTRKFSKKTTFVNIPWNLGKNQQIYSEIFGTLIDFRVTIPGNQLIFLFLNSYKSFKTEYIYKNQLWTICTYIGLWFEV